MDGPHQHRAARDRPRPLAGDGRAREVRYAGRHGGARLSGADALRRAFHLRPAPRAPAVEMPAGQGRARAGRPLLHELGARKRRRGARPRLPRLTMSLAAVDRLDDALARFGRLGLAHLPTPFEPMKRLGAHLGGPRLWVKRDDCTGLGLVGNKLRKLDYVLRAALDGGADTLVSGGVVQSNSQRQVAAAAAKLGLACHLAVYHGRLAAPSPDYERSGNALLNRLFGAHLHDVPWTGDRNGAIRTLVGDLEAKGHKPYLVPYGVSNALGAIAYASTAAEIARQCATLDIAPAAIVHSSGSAGTQAGLVVGARL